MIRTPLPPACAFERVVARRLRASHARVGQAAMIAGLAWLATHDPRVGAWLALTWGFVVIEAALSDLALRSPDRPRLFQAAAASQVLSAASFAGIAVVLLARPDALRLAEAVITLCAVTLDNALASTGSRLGTTTIVTPPAAMLVLSPIWVALAGSGERLPDVALLALGGLIYTVFVLRLSASRHAENEALRQAIDKTKADNQRWRSELEEARNAAEQANRAKTDFLAVMSHEIRTPLNGVLGMAQAMAHEPLAPRQQERLAVIRESGAALMDLLDDLLDLSRLEGGHLQLAAEDFDLRSLAESAHAAFAAEAEAKGLAFPLDVDASAEGLWRGDATRVRQLLSNLISNAVKFTHLGEVTVRVACSPDGVRIEVADTGIGIAPDQVAQLFEKFVQADASATRPYGGSGLGLAICQELCRAMGGAIRVDSAPGLGSTFAVELPLRQSSQPAAPAPQALAADRTLRVLAAEDNPVNRMVLRALLAQLDVDPAMVETGAEAVQAWEAAHWDLILMDVQMPVMDGPTAAMTIRAREALLSRPRTPIVAVTANTLPHQLDSYQAAGIDQVVGKPLNAADLFAAIVAAAAPAPRESDADCPVAAYRLG